ncbi:MAG TPA: 3-oxoacyl-[acyl-carrier-protein] reductase [Candidatus Marinimicrobia bacterium]|nr:3-oxoacyl-[acyl-carrier-protein] reductase [Candidatus Neomarinimicrobiota bacterium]
MFDLSGKVALVTGASRGIGCGIAKTLAENGAHVVCVSRNVSDVQSVADKITAAGGTATAVACDISDSDNVSKLIKETVATHDHLDILVNNAGVTRDNLLMRMSEDDWNTVLNINLKAAFIAIKAAARTMIKQRNGRIINISSVVGLMGNAGQANYAASKAGLIGLTKSTARELASRGITANCIAPGYVATDMTNELGDEVQQSLIEQIPLGRMGQVEDIASAVAFLASDEAAYITGQTLAIDGGIVM